MKLVYVLTNADGRAGTEKAFADQTNAMSARGHDVTVVSVYRRSEKGFEFGERTRVVYLTDLEGPIGSPSLVIPTEWDNQFCSAADSAITEFFRSCDADIVMTSTPALMVYAMLALPEEVKIVAQEHRATQMRGVTAEPLLRHGQRADAVVTLTERNREWLRHEWGGERPRIDVIPNAVPATGRPVSGRRQKVVMGVGRLVPAKGFVDLIRAFAEVSPDFPDWRLRLFGEGPQRSQLATTARNLGIADKVELMGTTTDIENEWSRASIGALCSRVEGLPLVLLEARAAGVPLVSYDCETGPREIISQGEDGFLVDVGDVAGFAESLRILMADESKRDAMASRGADSLERFHPALIDDAWVRILSDIASAPSTVRERNREESGRERTGPDSGAEIVQLEQDATSSAPATVEDPDASEAEERHAVRQAELGELVPAILRERNRQLLEQHFAERAIRGRPLATDSDRLKWAVRADDREPVLSALAEIDDPTLEVRLYRSSVRLDKDGHSWRNERDQVDWNDVTRVGVFHHFENTETRRSMGFAAGLMLEFWDLDEARPGLYRAPRRNREFDLLLPEQFDSPLFSPRAKHRSRMLWNSVQFPIDAVYTWVDGSDPEWKARKNAASGDLSSSDLAAGEVRYLNRDELRYSLRSLFANLPWIRHVYLVTDRQKPNWLVEDERLRVVDHHEIFPDPEALPVFNSHAIESAVHRIPGLAEHFIYLNDDGFFMREQRPDQYFSAAGHAKFFPSPTKINDLNDSAEPHEAAGANNRRLLEEKYGRTITQGMLHSPHPHRRDVIDYVEDEFKAQVDVTRRAKFRSVDDVSMLSSLAQYAGYFSGEYELGSLRVGFVSLGSPDADLRLTRVGSQALDYLTFGEYGNDPDPEFTYEMAVNFLRDRFPIPSPWERSMAEDADHR